MGERDRCSTAAQIVPEEKSDNGFPNPQLKMPELSKRMENLRKVEADGKRGEKGL